MFIISTFQIFFTPEDCLSSDYGVYVAETVATKNTKLAKSRFRLYDDDESVKHTLNIFSKFLYKYILSQNSI